MEISHLDRLKFDPLLVFNAGERNHHISNTAYPIAHDQTWSPYRIKNQNIEDHVLSAYESLDSINLYSHIPFCETRCYFCEYTVVSRKELNQTDEYMFALNSELRMYKNKLGNKVISGFDIGGGTPSFVEAPQIDQHINIVNQLFTLSSDCEISIETTPKIASENPEKLKAYISSGIKRISMGIQVSEPNLLKLLGRSENGIIHHKRAMENILNAGFKKINIDLMYGFANQNIVSWEHTLLHAISLNPSYITLYRMRYKLTRISAEAHLVSLATVKEQAKLAKKILTQAGYLANPGKNTYSRIDRDTGTSIYLTKRVIEGKPYLGIGLGAQSFTNKSISYNSGSVGKNLAPYLQKILKSEFPIQDFYQLPDVHLMAKMIAVSFYFGEINLFAFQSKFGNRIEDFYPDEIKFLLDEGYMHYSTSMNGSELKLNNGPYPKECLSLTEKGASHFNGCIAQFYAPSVKKYLLERDPNKNTDFHQNQKLASRLAEKDLV